METVRMGRSGLEVSRIILGCMSFGDPDRGTHRWSFGIDQARPLIKAALDAGITTFDTANVYSRGASEEIVGTLLAELTTREEVVIATKVHGKMGDGPKDSGLSRGAIMTQVDASLRRLGTDYIDLYQIHRYDPTVEIAETMEALHDLVRIGKVRYIGASSMWAWQFVQAQETAARHGWTKFVSMQDQYNLLMREEEREMLPYCAHTGVGVIPWSPLARGLLTRPWGSETTRSGSDRFATVLYEATAESDQRTVEAVSALAAERGVPMGQIAMAWVLAKQVVTAPIVGVTRAEHLADAVAAVDLELTEAELERLEASYTPRQPTGF
jgi:1-deoxyxylulose-5-phosphate synthase